MLTHLYCGTCHRPFVANVSDEKGTPQDHRQELLQSDLKRLDYGRKEFVGCNYKENCEGTLKDFRWWKDVVNEANSKGLNFPVKPDYGVKYEL